MIGFLEHLFSGAWLSASWERHALVAVLLMAPLSALLGVKVLTLRMSFFSDAVAHGSIVGLAMGALLVSGMGALTPTQAVLWSQLALLTNAVVIALVVFTITRTSKLSADATVAVVMAGTVSLGLVVVHQNGAQQIAQQLLYGDVLLIEPNIHFPQLAILLALGLAFSALAFNRGLLLGLSRPLAAAHGVREDVVELTFAILLALSVATLAPIVGVLLVSALLIVPAATARNLAGSAGGLARWAVLVSLISGVLGLSLSSYQESWPAGATIVLVNCMIFVLSLPIAAVRKRLG